MGVAATWPAVKDARSSFLAAGPAKYGAVPPGDHLQTGYALWLVGHQLERGAAPWQDPYSFRPEARPRANFSGWLFGLPYWPLVALLGPVRAWNVFTLATYVLAGGATFAWLRALALPAGAALAGGTAFALAPYRVGQSTGHLLGPISFLLPLALYGLERRRPVLAGAALAAIPLSGQVHLALGAIPLFLAYAWLRTRERLGAAIVGAAAAAGAGVLVHRLAITGSIESRGRSLAEVDRYSAQWADLVTRHVRHGLESFVFLGWATPALAALGLALLLRDGRRGLAILLAVAALVPVILALGTNLPIYTALWHAVPPLRYPRVPERLMPIACLALAALVAVVAARRRGVLLPALVVGLLFLDLRVPVYRALGGDTDNTAYAALNRLAPGRLLELPVFAPDRHFGSTYLYYAMQAPRERPGGYSTTAPTAALTVSHMLRGLNCGNWSLPSPALVRQLGVRHVAVHEALFAATPRTPRDCPAAASAGLRIAGFRLVARDGGVALFTRPAP